MAKNDVDAILARARGAVPPPGWTIRDFPRRPFAFSVGGVLRYLFGGLFFGFGIAFVVAVSVHLLFLAAGHSLPSAVGPRLFVVLGVGSWVAGASVIAFLDLSHGLLVITDHEAVMVNHRPMGLLRRTRVLEFARIRGMAVQEVRYEGDRTRYTKYRLVLRPVQGDARGDETWDIGCGESTYREIVDHFERTCPNDADGLSTLTFERLMDD